MKDGLPALRAAFGAAAQSDQQEAAGKVSEKQPGLVHLVAGVVQREHGVCYAVHHPPSSKSEARCVVLSDQSATRHTALAETGSSHPGICGETAHQVLLGAVKAEDHIRYKADLVGHHGALYARADGDNIRVFQDDWAQCRCSAHARNTLTCVPQLWYKADLSAAGSTVLRIELWCATYVHVPATGRAIGLTRQCTLLKQA